LGESRQNFDADLPIIPGSGTYKNKRYITYSKNLNCYNMSAIEESEDQMYSKNKSRRLVLGNLIIGQRGEGAKRVK
jgi:hypothetical protein